MRANRTGAAEHPPGGARVEAQELRPMPAAASGWAGCVCAQSHVGAHRAPPRTTLIAAQPRLGENAYRRLNAGGPLLRASGIRRSGGYFMAGGRLSERRSHPLVAFAI